MISSTNSCTAELPVSLPHRCWKRAKSLCVAAFVVWILIFIVYRNAAELWGDAFVAWVRPRTGYTRIEPELNRFSTCTIRFGSYCGIEQGWFMFGSPLARRTHFPAVLIQFTDGSDTLMLSGNEPDPDHFWRLGGFRQRKLEDHIACLAADEETKGEEAQLWSNYALWVYRHWRRCHPDDPRQAKDVILQRRTIALPGPGESCEHKPATTSIIARYTLDGRLAP
jgi:hypothetical protein